jgi:hypothetical protein
MNLIKDYIQDFYKIPEEEFLTELNFDSTMLEDTSLNQANTIFLNKAKSIFEAITSKKEMLVTNECGLHTGFNIRLYSRWREVIELLTLFSSISYQIGSLVNNKYRKRAAEENDIKFDNLVYIHARGSV